MIGRAASLQRRWAPVFAVVAGLLVAFPATPAERSPSFELIGGPSAGLRVAVLGLERERLASLRADRGISWTDWLSLHVADASNPPVAARYAVTADRVELRPRFPLEPGLEYVAVFRPRAFDALFTSGSTSSSRDLPSDTDVVEHRFEIPKPPIEATTTVEAVRPSRGVVPENLLKFYVHFSAPMTRGRAYRYLRILDARGEEVELAFLELEYELWDPETRRLTLLFDPGRLKAGLKPRREVGPALQGGFDFALEVDSQWPDAEGNPLAEGLVHRFRVGPPDYEQPDPETWSWTLPETGTREPLAISFGEPLDAALLRHALWVVERESGREVAGRVELAEEESAWRFHPEVPWKSVEHELRVDVLLEDLAGNSIARPFEVDLEGSGATQSSGSTQSSGRGATRGTQVWRRAFEPRR